MRRKARIRANSLTGRRYESGKDKSIPSVESSDGDSVLKGTRGLTWLRAWKLKGLSTEEPSSSLKYGKLSRSEPTVA